MPQINEGIENQVIRSVDCVTFSRREMRSQMNVGADGQHDQDDEDKGDVAVGQDGRGKQQIAEEDKERRDPAGVAGVGRTPVKLSHSRHLLRRRRVEKGKDWRANGSILKLVLVCKHITSSSDEEKN